jgi:hypothetical protein
MLDFCPTDVVFSTGYARELWRLTNAPPETRRAVGDGGVIRYHDNAEQMMQAYRNAERAYLVDHVQSYGIETVSTPEVQELTGIEARDAVLNKIKGRGLETEYQEPEVLPRKRKLKPRGKAFISVYQPRWGKRG